MSLGKLPPELEEFLLSKGYTLLIKGLPGTGKTTLALEIINQMADSEKAAYFSSRVSKEKLFTQFPWIKEKVSPEHVVQITHTKIEDVRLSSIRYLIEHVGGVLNEIKGGFLVLDSWDAFANELDPLQRLKTEKALISMGDASGARLIFVSEQFTRSSLEYIVDGMITLRQTWVFGERAKRLEREEYVERRSVREMEFEKLRGIAIKNRTYVFTLAGSRFTYIKPYEVVCVQEPSACISDLDENHLSTGIEELDEITGGLTRGSIFLMEIERGVGLRYLPLLHIVGRHAVKSGRAVLALLNLIPIPILERGVKEQEKGLKRPLSVVYPEELYDDTAVTYVREYERLKHSFKEVLEIIDLDAIESRFGYRKAVDFLIDASARAFSHNMPIMVLVKGGMASAGIASRLASTHIVLKEMDGSLLLYGVSPRTGLYSIVPEEKRFKMIPIL